MEKGIVFDSSLILATEKSREKFPGSLMISGVIDVNYFSKICLMLEAKYGDDSISLRHSSQ